MTDTTHDTELTPRDREMMRKGYAMHAHELGANWLAAGTAASRAIPEPPAYTYSAEVFDPTMRISYRRRSDGQWQASTDDGWYSSTRTDESVRALAACVQLSDAECDALIVSHWPDVTQRRDRVRAAFARVMRGEVAHG